ncbi:hypothetical protein D9M69_663030 [compost metagenome]
MRDQYDALLVSVFEQILVVLHGLDVGRLYRHEHEHEAGAAHTDEVGVVLGGQVVDMLAHRLDVLSHGQLTFFAGLRRYGTVVGNQ